MVREGNYGISVTLNLPYEEARERAIVKLKEQGFGLLTEIDVKKTLKEKLQIDFRKYTILGMCNPPLAHKALSAETEIGLLLPCNVVVYETDDGRSTVSAINAEAQLSVVGRQGLEDLAAEVRDLLRGALEALES